MRSRFQVRAPQEVPNVVDRVRRELYSKHGEMCLWRLCHSAGILHNASIDIATFRLALEQCGISLTEDELQALVQRADVNGDNRLNAQELSALLRGDLDHPGRRRVVLQAWNVLDPKNVGTVSIDTLARHFSAQRHPLVNAKQASEKDVLHRFLEHMQECAQSKGGPTPRYCDKKVTKDEFLLYYAGVSTAIGPSEDAAFECLVLQTWNVGGPCAHLGVPSSVLQHEMQKCFRTTNSYRLDAAPPLPVDDLVHAYTEVDRTEIPRSLLLTHMTRPGGMREVVDPYLTTNRQYGVLPPGRKDYALTTTIHRKGCKDADTKQRDLQATYDALGETKRMLEEEIQALSRPTDHEESAVDAQGEKVRNTTPPAGSVAEIPPEAMEAYYQGREVELHLDAMRRKLLDTPLSSGSLTGNWTTTYRSVHTNLLPALDRTGRDAALYVEDVRKGATKTPLWKDADARDAIADRVRARHLQREGYAEPGAPTSNARWVGGSFVTTTQAARYTLPALPEPTVREADHVAYLEARKAARVVETHGEDHEILQATREKCRLDSARAHDRMALVVRSGDPLHKTISKPLNVWDGERAPNRYVTTNALHSVHSFERDVLMRRP